MLRQGPAAPAFASGRAAFRCVDAAARRRGCTAREAVGLFFATQTGNTEEVAGQIAEAAGIEAGDAGEIEASDLASYDGLIDEVKEMDLKGNPVAIFGCGDSQGYGDNFCD